MAFNKRTWLGRQGVGLNKFSIDGATPVTIVNQPDSVTQVGDALSAGNLNDLEDRIEDAFDDVDTELDTKADEQDVTNLNNAITALDHRVQNLEQAKGDYVVSTYKDGDATPSGKGKWCVVEGVEGVSRVENNAVKNGDFSQGTSDWSSSSGTTFSVTDGVCTFTASAQYGQIENTNNITLDNTHFYVYSLKAKGSSSNSGLFAIVSGAGSGSVALNSMSVTTSWRTFAGVFKPQNNSTTAKVDIYDGRSSGWDAYQVKDVFFTDLNIYFGTSDLSFLGATDSAKLATIQTNYPELLEPSDYGTEVVFPTYEAVKSQGVNLWDEEWELGGINFTTGGDVVRTDTFRSRGYIKIQPFKSYDMMAIGFLSYGGYANILFYDVAMNYLGQQNIKFMYLDHSYSGHSPFTPPVNACYCRFVVGSGVTYNHDIQICDNSLPDAIKTTYHPYQSNTLSFPSTSLKSAGSVRDTLELNVEVSGVAKKRETQRIVSTALDNKTWIRRNDGLFYTSTPVFSDAKDSSSNVLCDKFLPCPSGQTGTSTPEGCISVGSGGYIYAMKSSIADTTAFLAYVADSVLYSEAKTESVTLSDPILDNTLLTEAYGRMSTVQTGTVVDGIADLGFITL